MRISDWMSDVSSSDLTHFASTRRTEAAHFADRIGREVIMQHEALVGQASKAVNHLLGVLGAERRGADRLRFATREQRRTMRARQEADDRLNRANLLRIAPIDALTILQNGGANDFGQIGRAHV